MKEITVENNINKSINALKIGELGYAKEYVNKILVEIPNHALAGKIREYIVMLKQKGRGGTRDKKDFLISTLKELRAKEMLPLIEFLCEEIKSESTYLGSSYVKEIIEQIEVSSLENEVLNNFYNWLKQEYPIKKAREEHNEQTMERFWAEQARKKRNAIIKKVLIGLAVVGGIFLLIMLIQTGKL